MKDTPIQKAAAGSVVDGSVTTASVTTASATTASATTGSATTEGAPTVRSSVKPTENSTGSVGLFVQTLSEHFSKLLGSPVESWLDLGDAVMRVKVGDIKQVMSELKSGSALGASFEMFLSVTVVDWMDQAEERFEVVYHLLSLEKRLRVRVKAWVPEVAPEVDSVADLWVGANFMEREAWDMYGVVFKGHPDLRRILMYDEFQGYPLRKDYPVQGKQPRIPLRAPEVRNTAVDMIRPGLTNTQDRASGGLVHIGNRKQVA